MSPLIKVFQPFPSLSEGLYIVVDDRFSFFELGVYGSDFGTLRINLPLLPVPIGGVNLILGLITLTKSFNNRGTLAETTRLWPAV